MDLLCCLHLELVLWCSDKNVVVYKCTAEMKRERDRKREMIHRERFENYYILIIFLNVYITFQR